MMNRQEALAAGAKTYIGRPCKHEHTSGLRNISSRACVECARSSALRWHAARREEMRAYAKRYYSEHREERVAYAQERRLEQRVIAFDNMRRRATLLSLPIDVTHWSELEPCPEHCPICGVKMERASGFLTATSPSVDRTVPEKGYVTGNRQWMCHSCNCKKG